MNMMSVVCCTPPTTPGHKIPSSHFFDPLQSLKEGEKFCDRFYEQSADIENVETTKMMKASSPDESPFGIVDINPGQLPRYVGDSGCVNPAFSADTPVQTPKKDNDDTKVMTETETCFEFPSVAPTTMRLAAFPTTPCPDAIVLDKPPVRRNSQKAPPPPPPTGDTLKKKPLPPLKSVESTTTNTSTKPIVDHLVPVKPSKQSMSPRKRVPSDTYVQGDSLTDHDTPAVCPPRPPKPSPSQRHSLVIDLAHSKPIDTTDDPAPPLPPKTYLKTFSLHA